ncbi:MAG: hypothetical protein KZQ83_10695 [gamma proteobacterium symbiont of Taylorina sp.]|nr:hypothetical protein [gamma proteobacterium symbiont of Taylorina sp.]
MLKNIISLILFLPLMNACSSPNYTRTGSEPYSAPVINKTTVNNNTVHYEDTSQPKLITTAALDRAHQPAAKKHNSIPASRQAVVDLLSRSKQALNNNQYVDAENYLKRALRIEPGNARLWHNMAVVNFYQENYQQAIQQALKSTNLTINNRQLIANNKKVIKQSYIELGEPDKAQQY